ncbi:unnamed protein product [Cylicostephanus goldi]|uniref:MULE transposase domain-containing protein n=1 Tax=Cylicostephanus goldi TaxID=71465 RepID=A0A3P7MJL2_CYLGO|nr:unnamed protein product [Cylicostephanus goldi]
MRYKKSKRVYPQCPCFALVKQKEDGCVSVVACFGHLGHEINNATTRLSTSEEDVVLNMIKSGIPDQMIVVKLREEFWNEENPPERQARLCYLTTRDVYNIAARHGEVAGRWDPDDRTSLKVLLRNDKSLAAVKLVETNNSSGDGFVLAFVSKNGKKYIEHFGSRGIVMDDTFNVTRYSFRLASLIVSDDSGRGFPSAHLLSFHMTSAEVKILFELVKECVPTFNPSYVITDDTYVFFNGFKEVIIPLLNVILSQGDDVQTANDLFKAVLFEVNEAKFESYFYAYMSFLGSIDAQDMINVCHSSFKAFIKKALYSM